MAKTFTWSAEPPVDDLGKARRFLSLLARTEPLRLDLDIGLALYPAKDVLRAMGL